MNKRIKKKVTINVASKILARIVEPGIRIKVARVEKEVFRKNKAFITHLVIEARKDYFN